MSMNWSVVEENWNLYVGSVKNQWEKFTDDHITTIAGNRENLSGTIQETYGVGIDEAEKQIREFEGLYKI
jgi:uncharacterized protein YjbJ (UPF0337 family)